MLFLQIILLSIPLLWSSISEATHCSDTLGSKHFYCQIIDHITFENCKLPPKKKDLNIYSARTPPIPGFSSARTNSEVIEILRRAACEFLPVEELDTCSQLDAATYNLCWFMNHGYTTQNCEDFGIFQITAQKVTQNIRSLEHYSEFPISKAILPKNICQYGALLRARKSELLAEPSREITECTPHSHTPDPVSKPIAALHENIQFVQHAIEENATNTASSVSDSRDEKSLITPRTSSLPPPNVGADVSADARASDADSVLNQMKEILHPFISLTQEAENELYSSIITHVKSEFRQRLSAAIKNRSTMVSKLNFTPESTVEILSTPQGNTYINFPEIVLGRGHDKKVTLCIDFSGTQFHSPLIARSLIQPNDPTRERQVKRIADEMQELAKIQEKMRMAHAPLIPQLIHSLAVKIPTKGGTQRLYIMEKFDSDLWDLKEKQGDVIFMKRNQTNFALQISKQLEVLHHDKLVHRDIKPGNILVQKNSEVARATLADFGITDSLSNLNDIDPVGTSSFFAPELARLAIQNKVSLNPINLKAVDIFALGLTFYYLRHQESGCDSGTADEFEHYRRLSTFSEISQLCQKCKVFCDPRKPTQTQVPVVGTFDHLIYSMLNPVPGLRPTIEQVVRELSRLEGIKAGLDGDTKTGAIGGAGH